MGISPKEAFDALKILRPATSAITKPVGSIAEIKVHPLGEYPYTLGLGQTVDWGNTTEYPLPEPKWRDARPEDLTYPHKAVRFRDHDNNFWEYGKLVGIAYRGSKPVWIDEAAFHYWQCQVRDEA